MCSEALANIPRPKIELIRVSSSERAKIPLNPVQLTLTYRHVRSATYVPPDAAPTLHYPYLHQHIVPCHQYPYHRPTTTTTTPTSTSRRPWWLWAPWKSYTQRNSHTDAGLSSKSCEELHRVSIGAPVCSKSEGCLVTLLLTPRSSVSPRAGTKYRVWRGFSRSARDIRLAKPPPPRPSVSLATAMDKLVPQHTKNKASTLPYSAASGPRPAARRHRGLIALLRRLSPRLRRSPSPDPPWVKVEPRPPDRNSVASDHSFEAALQVRYPELTQNTLSPEDTRGSKGTLSSLFTSLRPNKQSKHPELRPNGHTNTEALPPVPPATLVPPPHLITTQVDSRPKGDITTTTVPLYTSTRPTASAQRPHTLNLPTHTQHHHPHTRIGAVGVAPAPQQLSSVPPQMSLYAQTQTASVDSIGSCSLDVNATGTTSPATMEVLDGSQRSLRSISLENNLSQITSGGVSGPTTPVRPILKPQPYTDPGSGRDEVNYKTPSYLGISCAVNGYNRLNRYDSSLRDGFRSRDASPARLAFSRSRDSSPMRPEWKVFDSRTKISPQETAAKIKELKEELAKFKAEFPQPPGERGRQNLSKKPSRRGSNRSVSVDRGYLTKAETMNGVGYVNGGAGLSREGERVRMVEITMTDASPTFTKHRANGDRGFSVRSERTEHSTHMENSTHANISTHYTQSSHIMHTNGDDSPDKSFIQSRIERLYGPSALGAGFRSRRSLLELEKEQRDRESRSPARQPQDSPYDPDAKAPDGFPSVFRHLRPEFRTQLQVKRSGLADRMKSGEPLVSPGLVESPKRPGRVIPISIEGREKPRKPVTSPKPDLTPVSLISPTNNNRRATKPAQVPSEASRELISPKLISREVNRENIGSKQVNIESFNREPVNIESFTSDSKTNKTINGTEKSPTKTILKENKEKSPTKTQTQSPTKTILKENTDKSATKTILKENKERLNENKERLNGNANSVEPRNEKTEKTDKSPVKTSDIKTSNGESTVLKSALRTSSENGIGKTDKSELKESDNCVLNEEEGEESGEKDGHYFLKVVEGVVRGISEKADKVEAEMELGAGDKMNEEVRGMVLAAIGKARLLVSQKIQQFQGLCHKNIADSAGEEFPTTCGDLAGFWDMVSIQVDDVNNLFVEIDGLRANGWKKVDKVDGRASGEVTTGRARRKPAPKPARPATKKSSEKTAEGKSREEARRKMMDERRKAMKEAMKAKKMENAGGGGDAVEIFVPEDK